MPISRHKKYVIYAKLCLKMADIAKDGRSRVLLRKMAAELLKIPELHETYLERTQAGGVDIPPARTRAVLGSSLC